MKSIKFILSIQIGLMGILLAGCDTYRGAVYTEYQQFDLDIRATTTSGASAPIDVNLGYDRGVFAYVPKQNGETNSTQGEAVSLISWNNLSSQINPFRLSTNSLLTVDAGFITGVAADIITAPTNATVTIVAAGLTNTIQTYGGAGERIQTATSVFAAQAVADGNKKASELAIATNDGNGKVAPDKLDALVKGTLLQGNDSPYYNVSVDMLRDKLMGSWRPYIDGMVKNYKPN